MSAAMLPDLAADGPPPPDTAAPVSVPALVIDGVSKSYKIFRRPADRLLNLVAPGWCAPSGEHRALEQVSLTVAKGETVGIIGENGSGKSTLLQIVAGVLAPSSGSVRTSGRISALLELGTGFNPDFSGRENVFLNGAILGLTRDEVAARFEAIAAFADIGDFIEQPVKTYSSGMVVRLAFAVAVHVDAAILIVDEALSVGDERFQRKCFARIEQFKRDGGTILFVSHSAAQVVALCDRALLLDHGHALLVGGPKRVTALYHKLLFAAPDSRAELRRQLLQGDVAAAEGDAFAPAGGIEHAAAGDEFDPGMVPKSTVRYDPQGAVIDHPLLRNEAGDQVNILQPGGRYMLEYHVRFDRSARSVGFGTLMKTIDGIELGGVDSTVGTIDEVLPGQQYRVRHRFTCRLAAGTFFMNTGVTAIENGDLVYLHRIVDALMFRIAPHRRDRQHGWVDFEFDPSAVPVEA
jgi:lipopolysaccharide transport system ATP-binding protein